MVWALGSSLMTTALAGDHSTGRWAREVLNSLDNHPRVVAGQAAREMASAKIDGAKQPLYEPHLGLEWKQRGSQSAGANFEVFVTQQIDIAGKSEARTRQFESDGQAVREDYRLVRQDLLQTLLNSLTEQWITARLLEIAKQREARLAEFIRVLEKYETAGRLSAYEVDNGYLRLADAVRMVAEADENFLQSSFQVRGLIGESSIPDHLPIEALSSIGSFADAEKEIGDLAAVSAARWRYESSQAALDAVDAERHNDPTVGVIGGKDENDNFIGVGVVIPLALRSSKAPFREASSQAALGDRQRYIESYRKAENRLKNAWAVYRSLFERWTHWRSLTTARLEDKKALPRRLWDAGEISSVDYLAMLNDREDARIAGIRLSARVWKAWIEWLASRDKLEPWLRELAGLVPDR